jgi:hypothetical protein
MSGPASIDSVQPHWVRLDCAYLVLRGAVKHLTDGLVAEYAADGCRSCAVTDTTIDIGFVYDARNVSIPCWMSPAAAATKAAEYLQEHAHLAEKLGSPRPIASAHPKDYGRYLHSTSHALDQGPIPYAVVHGVVHAVWKIESELISALWDMHRAGAVTLMARVGSPLAGFSPIAPDVFSGFGVEDWEAGAAKSPDGSWLYAIHLYRTADAQGPLTPQINGPGPKPKQHAARQQDFLRLIIFPVLFSDGVVPPPELLPEKQLVREVQDECTKQIAKRRLSIAVPSRRTILRAADRQA